MPTYPSGKNLQNVVMNKKNACAILGARLVYYWREPFDFKHVKSSESEIVQKIQQERPSQYICCGCLLEPESENYEEKITEENEMRRRCGFRYSCDSCIQMTTNGSYLVDDIASKIVECTTYCFYCNQDKCGKQTHNDSIMTMENLLDELIDGRFGEIQAVDEKMGAIKNYYVLNDCLHC